jgi:hypothetical protein
MTEDGDRFEAYATLGSKIGTCIVGLACIFMALLGLLVSPLALFPLAFFILVFVATILEAGSKKPSIVLTYSGISDGRTLVAWSAIKGMEVRVHGAARLIEIMYSHDGETRFMKIDISGLDKSPEVIEAQISRFGGIQWRSR